MSLRIIESTAPELCMSTPERQLRQEVIRWKISFDTMTLGAIRVQHENCRRPLCSVFRAQSLEFFSLITNVDAHGNEIFRDEARYALIGIHLGIQPSTATSHRSCAKIEQYRFLLRAGFLKRVFKILLPGDL